MFLGFFFSCHHCEYFSQSPQLLSFHIFKIQFRSIYITFNKTNLIWINTKNFDTTLSILLKMLSNMYWSTLFSLFYLVLTDPLNRILILNFRSAQIYLFFFFFCVDCWRTLLETTIYWLFWTRPTAMLWHGRVFFLFVWICALNIMQMQNDMHMATAKWYLVN